MLDVGLNVLSFCDFVHSLFLRVTNYFSTINLGAVSAFLQETGSHHIFVREHPDPVSFLGHDSLFPQIKTRPVVT